MAVYRPYHHPRPRRPSVAFLSAPGTPPPPEDATWARVVSFAKNTGAAGSTNTVSGLPGEPRAVIFSFGGATADNTPTAGISAGIGFAARDGTQGSASAWSTDNVTPSNANRYLSNTRAITIVGASTLLAAGQYATASDGFTITWTTNDSTATIIDCLVLGGTDLTNAKVVDYSIPAATGNVVESGVGFQPDVVFHLNAGGQSVFNSFAGGLGVNVGAMTATNQFAAFALSGDGSASSNTYTLQATDAVVVASSGTPSGPNCKAVYQSMDADGFTVNVTVAPSGARSVVALCLAGGEHKVGGHVKPTGAAPVSGGETGFGFAVRGLFLVSDQGVAATTTTDHNRYGVGMADGTNERAVAWTDTDNSNPTQADNYHANGKAFVTTTNGTGAVEAEADATLGSDGFSLNWTTNNGVASKIFYYAYGEVAATGDQTGTVSVGTAAASEIAATGSAGALGAVSVGAAAASGVASPASAGATGTVAVGTAAGSGVASPASASTIGTVWLPVENPSFERGIAEWGGASAPGSGITVSRGVDAAAANHGTQSLYLTITANTNATPGTGVSQFNESYVAVMPDTAYTISADVWTDNHTNLQGVLRLNWYTSGLVFISEGSAVAIMSASSTWQRKSATVTSPATAAFALPVVSNLSRNSSMPTGTVRYDAVQIEPRATATSYQHGEVVAGGSVATAGIADVGTVSVGSAAASGVASPASSGALGAVAVGTAASSGVSSPASAGALGTVSVGSAASAGIASPASAGALGSVAVGSAAASGTSTTGTGGSSGPVHATGTVSVGTAAASGIAASAGVGYTGIVWMPLVNSSFEDGTLSWSAGATASSGVTATMSIDAVAANHRTNSMAIQITANTNAIAGTGASVTGDEFFAAVPGQTYTVSADAWSNNHTNLNAGFGVNWYTSAQSLISLVVENHTLSAGSTWQRKESAFIAPSNAAYGKVNLRNRSANTSMPTGTVRYDAVQLEPRATATAYKHGAATASGLTIPASTGAVGTVAVGTAAASGIAATGTDVTFRPRRTFSVFVGD